MKRSRNTYPDELKQEAVRLLSEQRLPRSQVARALGIDPATLRRWARELAPDSAGTAATPKPPAAAFDARRLQSSRV